MQVVSTEIHYNVGRTSMIYEYIRVPDESKDLPHLYKEETSKIHTITNCKTEYVTFNHFEIPEVFTLKKQQICAIHVRIKEEEAGSEE